MKNARNYLFMTAALAAGIVVAAGCNQLVEEKPIADKAAEATEVSGANESKSGCCGKCKTGQDEPVAAAVTAGCCGKCGCESETSSVSKEGGATEKCENCTTESAAVSKKAGESVITCENGCNACAEGNSANCKCGDAATAKQPKNEVDDATANINSMPEDRDVFHYLLEHHDKITRTVTKLDNGVKTITESTDPVVTAKIQEHVASMYKRVEDGRPLRMWDEMYREIFKHAGKIKMELTNTKNGISVTETSDDDYVVKLIQAHGEVVSGFAKRGFDEARQNHKPPAR